MASLNKAFYAKRGLSPVTQCPMHDYFEVADIARLIQLAVAPVFLLAGIGGVMMVLSLRMNRFIDRARVLETRLANLKEPERRKPLEKEFKSLIVRIQMARWSLGLSIASELLICALIALLFLGGIFHFDGSFLLATLFVVAMLFLMLGLLILLREVYLSYSGTSLGRSLRESK